MVKDCLPHPLEEGGCGRGLHTPGHDRNDRPGDDWKRDVDAGVRTHLDHEIASPADEDSPARADSVRVMRSDRSYPTEAVGIDVKRVLCHGPLPLWKDWNVGKWRNRIVAGRDGHEGTEDELAGDISNRRLIVAH